MDSSGTSQQPANTASINAAPSSTGSNDRTSPNSPTASANASSVGKSPSRKRRKVTHACVYCRRSHMTCDDERPCTRCVKRHIGHLCHDEHRDPKKKDGPGSSNGSVLENGSGSQVGGAAPFRQPSPPAVNNGTSASTGLERVTAAEATPVDMSSNSQQIKTEPAPAAAPGPAVSRSAAPPIAAPAAVSAAPRNRPQNFLGTYSAWEMGHAANNAANNNNSTASSNANAEHWNPYHHNWMFPAQDVSNEFNLLSDFAGAFNDDSSFFNEATFFGEGPVGPLSGADGNHNGANGGGPNRAMTPGNAFLQRAMTPLQRPNSVKPSERAKETYWLTAADPGRDAPEDRMRLVLKAKYEAGLLQPFNYVKGYQRLHKYMESNMSASSRKRIIVQLDRFRPKFRETAQKLTDLDLVAVEEWFEKTMLDYDRVFASMAVPACLWRRTGQIYRGNKEFAELINVPIDKMRDGSLAIYELISEGSAAEYWEKFGTIAFDTSQKAMITTCQLLNPHWKEGGKEPRLIPCCFSFTVRRDSYDIPSAIIGNFLPITNVD